MLKKFYEKVKEFIKTEYKFILFLIVFVVICTWPVNYYIVIGGGISDISDRVVVENGDSSDGSFNLSYVSELKGTTLSYLLSYVMPHWKRVSMDDYVIVKFPEYDNPLEVGDKLLKVNGVLCANLVEFQEAIQKVEGNSVRVTVLRDGKEMELTSKLYEEENRKVLGVGLQSVTTYDVDPEVEFQFEKNESGPSAGLITTLSIYDQLTKGDLTKGKLIAGTGTIEADGSIGQIGEVEYKLLVAVDGGAQVFLVPAGENYQDCKKMKKEENLDIKLISVKNIDDAIKKLKDL